MGQLIRGKAFLCQRQFTTPASRSEPSEFRRQPRVLKDRTAVEVLSG